MASDDTRRALEQAIATHRAELDAALVDLRRAAVHSVDVVGRLRDAVRTRPTRWLAAALLVGIWLGRRAGRNVRDGRGAHGRE